MYENNLPCPTTHLTMSWNVNVIGQCKYFGGLGNVLSALDFHIFLCFMDFVICEHFMYISISVFLRMYITILKFSMHLILILIFLLVSPLVNSTPVMWRLPLPPPPKAVLRSGVLSNAGALRRGPHVISSHRVTLIT